MAHIRKAKLLVYRQAERFSNAVRKLFSVPKEAILKAESKWQRAQTFKKKRAKKPP